MVDGGHHQVVFARCNTYQLAITYDLEFRMTLIDELTRECLAIRVARRINSFGVIETMADVMLTRGVPEHIRSDNGAEMTAKIVRNWFAKLGAKTLYIAPGTPWENG